jgi:AraC family transcriptional regulator
MVEQLRMVSPAWDAPRHRTVSLADMASEVGLTRMHFAAQFKAATGLRPRIERAQEMLVGTDMSLVDVALAVGFQTQSHFTTIFRRFVGQSPLAWRESRDNATIAGCSTRKGGYG